MLMFLYYNLYISEEITYNFYKLEQPARSPEYLFQSSDC
jgi:hypothetical protein